MNQLLRNRFYEGGQIPDFMNQNFSVSGVIHLPSLYLEVDHTGCLPRAHASHRRPNGRRRGTLHRAAKVQVTPLQTARKIAQCFHSTCIHNIKPLHASLHMRSSSANRTKVTVNLQNITELFALLVMSALRLLWHFSVSGITSMLLNARSLRVQFAPSSVSSKTTQSHKRMKSAWTHVNHVVREQTGERSSLLWQQLQLDREVSAWEQLER